MIHYHEYQYWCVYRDANVSRVSIVDSHGKEFFQIVTRDGKGYKERREAAIDACLGAIEAGCDPGEVRLA